MINAVAMDNTEALKKALFSWTRCRYRCRTPSAKPAGMNGVPSAPASSSCGEKPIQVLLLHYFSRLIVAVSFCRARNAFTLILDGFQPVRSQISATDFSSRYSQRTTRRSSGFKLEATFPTVPCFRPEIAGRGRWHCL